MKKNQTTTEKARAQNNRNSYAPALLVLPILTLASTSLVHASSVASNNESVNDKYLDTQFEELYGDNFEFDDFEVDMSGDELGDEFSDIISDTDLDTLSLAQIDAKLKAAGKEVIGDTKDPLYNMTPAQVEALTEAQWKQIDAQFEALYGNDFEDEDFQDDDLDFDAIEDDFDFSTLEDEFGGVINDSDWDTLSLAQIDAKLKVAGKETIGNPKDPLYNMTPEQVEALSDAQWAKFEAQYQELYGNQ